MQSPLSTSLRSLLVLSLAVATAAAQSVIGTHHEVVQAAGDSVAALPGVTIQGSSNFTTPVMDQDGTILYQARLVGGTLTGAEDRAYFLGRGAGDVTMILRAGDQAPGCAAGTLLRTSSASGSAGLTGSPILSPFGEILLFRSALYDSTLSGLTPTTSDSALFWGPATAPQLLCREGEPVPGLPGVNWGETASNLGNQLYRINTAGTVLFITPLAGAVTTTNDLALFTGTFNSLVPVIREGDLIGSDVVTTQTAAITSSLGAFQLNELGQVLHTVRFTSATAASSDQAILIWNSGVNTIILREGDPAPGTVGAAFGNAANTWSPSPSSANFTNAGTTLLRTELTGGDTVVGTNDTALYRISATGHTLLARRGDAAPGIPGATINVINTTGHCLTNAGDALFHATLAGPATTADTALFLYSGGVLTTLAQEGQLLSTLPGSPNPAGGVAPWTIGDMSPSGPNFIRMNDKGQRIGQFTITDGTTTKSAWFAYDATLGWKVLADLTETFTTSTGTTTPTSWSNGGFLTSTDGGLNWFNNAGDIVMKSNGTSPINGAVVRTHIGSLTAKPASINTATGGSQTWTIDCGPARAFNIYLVMGTSTGTRPGQILPFGPQNVPLNFDILNQLSFDWANGAVYSNTLSLLDANGRSTASLNVPVYPSVAGLNLHHAVLVVDFSLAMTFVSEPAAVRLF